MNHNLKIVMIGGGSSYTSELFNDFIIRYHQWPVKEIWLMDVEKGKETIRWDVRRKKRTSTKFFSKQ